MVVSQQNKDKVYHNFQLVSAADEVDNAKIYDELKNGHTFFYESNKRPDTKGNKWKQLLEELSVSKSKFGKRLRDMEKEQTSSGIIQVLEKIEESSKQTSDAVYGNAIDEQEMKTKFPDCITTNDPYDNEQKLRIHEAIQADGAVGRALSFWRRFLMGRDIFVDFKTKKELDPVLMDAIEERLALHPDITNYKNRLREIDDEVDVRKAFQNISDNLFGFGRAVLVMLFGEDQIPIRLVPLSSLKLGRVYIDKNTFEFLGVEYLEIDNKKNILLASDILYFTVNDNNVTPNSRYYGRSLIFPVLSIAENNLINRERNFPEIIRKRWAATLLIKTATRSTVRNQAIADKVNDNAGGSVVIPDLVSAENIKVDTELNSLIDFTKESDQKIFRDLELPNAASGFLEFSNTSEAQAELHVWSESTLEDMREIITDSLVKQWYARLLLKIIEKDVIENGVETKFNPPPVFDPEAERNRLQEEQRDRENQERTPQPDGDEESPDDNNAREDTEETEEPPLKSKEKAPQTPTEVAQNAQVPDDKLTLLESLGFDINRFFDDTKTLPTPNDDELKNMVINKLANITADIYDGVIEPRVEDIISMTREVKFPFKIYIKFANIIFDTFLDRSAGVLGIRSSGVIDDDIALELMKLERYIPKMRKIRMQKERMMIEQMKGKLLAAQNQIAGLGGNPNAPVNGQPVGQPPNDPDQIERQEEKEAERNTSNPTNTGIAAANKVNNRIASRINRGRVG